MLDTDLSEAPEFIRGFKSNLIIELQNNFPLNRTVFNSIGGTPLKFGLQYYCLSPGYIRKEIEYRLLKEIVHRLKEEIVHRLKEEIVHRLKK